MMATAGVFNRGIAPYGTFLFLRCQSPVDPSVRGHIYSVANLAPFNSIFPVVSYTVSANYFFLACEILRSWLDSRTAVTKIHSITQNGQSIK